MLRFFHCLMLEAQSESGLLAKAPAHVATACYESRGVLWPNFMTPRCLHHLKDFKVRQDDVFIISYPKSGNLHSKNTRVSRDPEKGSLGPNSIPGQRWPEIRSNWQMIGSDWPSSGSYFTSSWLIFRVNVDPEWSLAPMDPFPGHADPGCF